MTTNYEKHFSEQEMFAPARTQILTETCTMKIDVRGTNAKSNRQRIINLAVFLSAYPVSTFGAQNDTISRRRRRCVVQRKHRR